MFIHSLATSLYVHNIDNYPCNGSYYSSPKVWSVLVFSFRSPSSVYWKFLISSHSDAIFKLFIYDGVDCSDIFVGGGGSTWHLHSIINLKFSSGVVRCLERRTNPSVRKRLEHTVDTEIKHVTLIALYKHDKHKLIERKCVDKKENCFYFHRIFYFRPSCGVRSRKREKQTINF